MTPEEGAVVVTRRAKLYAKVKGLGGMALVHLAFPQICQELGSRRDIVAAIYSSPLSSVISGELAALDEYLSDLKKRNIKTFRVNTDIPFHSPMLEDLVGPLEKALGFSLNPRPAKVPLYSTSYVDARTDDIRNVDYWTNNMVNPVYLHGSVEAALDDGLCIFLEVSTHPIVAQSNNLLARRSRREI